MRSMARWIAGSTPAMTLLRIRPQNYAIEDHHLEHQFGTAADRSGRQIHQDGSARYSVSPGNQVSGRPLSAQTFQAARLRERRPQRPEGLSRRRRDLAAAVRAL